MPYCADKTRRLVLAALLVAAGVCLNIIEAQFPLPLPVPGAKLGLANAATLFCLYILPLPVTAAVLFLRLIIAALLTGSFFSSAFFLALAGGAASVVFMAQAKNIPGLSPLGVSLIGAAAHNTGQLAMAAFLLESAALFYYLPLLLFLAVPAGCVTGLAVKKGLVLICAIHSRQ